MRYILYSRKSQEDKLRQVQSIGDQISELRKLAQRNNLTIVQELREERSAKSPGRPVFNAMLESILAGDADGILVWSINRLLRNPVDEGTIKWMLQEGQIKSIVTMDKEHTPQDNVLLLGMESGVATQFILDLRKGVLRGLRSKLEKGWYPHRAPLGYLNDKYKERGERTIIKDPVLFPLIRTAWELMLTRGYTVAQVMRTMNEKYGVRTLPRRNGSGGLPVPSSTWYRLFSNVFYAGYFMHNGQLYKGAHEPMVTLEEFDRLQKMLGTDNPIKPRTRELAFTGIMRCAICGGGITGEVKSKPSGKTYTYYHCQNKSGICGKSGVREDRLEQQVDEYLARVTMRQDFYGWARDIIKQWETDERIIDHARVAQQQRNLQEVEKQINALLGMRMRELITDEEFLGKKQSLVAERITAQKEVGKEEQRVRSHQSSLLNAMEFSAVARERFKYGDPTTKRILMKALGSNFTLNHGLLALELHPMLLKIQQKYEALRTKYEVIELQKMSYESTKKQRLHAVSSIWCSIWEDYRTETEHTTELFPDLSYVLSVEEANPSSDDEERLLLAA